MAQNIVDLTPRDFLASLNPPLAKAGARGRFGKDATAALATARADGFLFIGDPGHPQTEAPKVKIPKAPKVQAPAVSQAPAATVVQTGTVNPKEVRAWAKQNGHEVGERGRIHGSVVTAFLKAGGKATVPTAARPTPADMPKVRPQSTGYVVERGTLIALTTCASKGGCGKAVSRCACTSGPKAPHYLDAGVAGTPLLLSKPAL